MKDVYIVSAKRTAVGSFLGSLKDLSPALFGAEVVKAIVSETNIDTRDIDEVIIGNILPAGQGQGVARQVAVFGGVDISVPAYSLNMACGSGMKALMIGYTSIASGRHNLVLAGGTESMSQSPYLIPYASRDGIKMGQFKVEDHMLKDALQDAFEGYHMGVTAENIVAKYNISRIEQDEFAINSQTKALAAIKAGKFKNEIVPVTVKVKRNEVVFDTDEYPNASTSLEKLSNLRPAFKKDGSVTAGNASGINDGASLTLLASEEMVEKYNLKPLAKIVGIGQGGVDPSVMGLGPTVAIRAALKDAGLSLDEIGLIELNEAFAAQSLGVVHELVEEHKVDRTNLLDKTNVNGGAIAIGHPVGASGNRIIVTLVHEMLKSNVKYGLASLCIGGGMGTAVILESVE